MISLDQVYLLAEKVESAVEKIQQLQAENDALRRKCSELTNALSSKTEQLNTFSVDQDQIEEGIRKALDRLNYIENSILKATDQAASYSPTPVVETKPEMPVAAKAAIVQTIISTPQESNQSVLNNKSEEELAIKETFAEDAEPSLPDFQESNLNFNSMNEIKSKTEMDLSEQFTEEEDFSDSDFNDEENSDGLGFDIF